MTPSAPPPRSRIRWASIAAISLGVVLGAWLGAQYAFLDSGPASAPLPATFGLVIGTVALAGVLLVLGLLLLLVRGTRPIGRFLLETLLAFLVAWPIGRALGPEWQDPRASSGVMSIEIDAPVSAALSGPATCSTEPNGDRIDTVVQPDLGAVGIDRLDARITLSFGSPSIHIGVNGGFGYEGPLTIVEAGPDRLTGEGSFDGIRSDRQLIGGPSGPATISGTVTWACESALPMDGGASPNASGAGSTAAPVIEEPLQGFFVLEGIVDMPDPCSGDGPCEPFGLAEGTCSSDIPLRTREIRTIVPWIGTGRAGLTLIPGRETATLTVLVEGSPAETVSAPAELVEEGSGSPESKVRRRTLTAEFTLADGPLRVQVEWQCGERVEGR